MAARPWCISLETSRGPVCVYPKEVTGVDASYHHTTPVSIYHGTQNRATVYISWDEARSLIGMLPKPWNCPAYSGHCYGRREIETPATSCLSCQLRKLCYVNREGDLRMRLEQPAHPMKIPCVVVLCVFPFMWLHFYTSAQSAQEAHLREARLETRLQAAERDREALRREKHPATFRRQAAAAGAKRAGVVKKGRKPTGTFRDQKVSRKGGMVKQ